jgi:hypothetical protein
MELVYILLLLFAPEALVASAAAVNAVAFVLDEANTPNVF